MKLRKALWGIMSATAMAFGVFALAAMPRQNEAIETNAISYTRAKRSMTENDGAITATLTISDFDVGTLEGWLLCLLNEKPTSDPVTRKIENSANRHPYSDPACSHYFFAESTEKEGEVTITWPANSGDQKEGWVNGTKTGEEGHTLKDYLAKGDWYIVIGPRHYNSTWDVSGATEGNGIEHIWENLDYYVGLESNVLHGSYGETYLDLSEYPDWEKDDAKFAVYYYNDTADGWSDFAVKAEGKDHIYLASYEMDFTPTHMIGVRLSKDATTPNWDKKQEQTADLDFHGAGVIGVYGLEESYSSWSSSLAVVKGLEKDVTLNLYKRNFSDHSEHYNEGVVLKAGDEFTIAFGGNNYKAFTVHDTINGAFVINGDKIHVNVAGTYAFYFDTDEKVRSLYITDPVLASADEWAQDFLKGGCTVTKSSWGSHKDAFYALSKDAQDILCAVPHEADPDKEVEGFIAKAIQRYDYVLTLYGEGAYEDFMDRVSDGKFVLPAHNLSSFSDSTGSTAVIVVLSLAVVGIAGTIVFAKKRKHQA